MEGWGVGDHGSRLVIIPEKLTGGAKERTQGVELSVPKERFSGQKPPEQSQWDKGAPWVIDTGMDHLRHLLGDLLQ